MKKLFLIILYVFSSAVFQKSVAATELPNDKYFIFNTDTNLVPYQKIMLATFKYSLVNYKTSDFIVRPILKRGIVRIFNQETDKWVGQNDLWTNMPDLNQQMKLKIDLSGSSDLWFQIQNTFDGQVYETPKKTIWGQNIYSNYINKVNKNAKMYVLRQDLPKVSTSKAQKSEQKPTYLLAKVIKYIGEII